MGKSYLHDFDSRIPAIQLLLGIGWNYLSGEEALKLRDLREDQVVLNGILQPWLAANNRFRAKGGTHKFSDNNIHEAIRRLTDKRHDGLARANQRLYQLLTLGTALEQSVAGDRKGRSLHYIDWQNPHNNVFHFSDGFSVRSGHLSASRQLDLVLFVNGIPFVIIECCSSRQYDGGANKPLYSALRRLIDLQLENEIPGLFQTLQLLLVSDGNNARYAPVNTAEEFWSQWREENTDEAQLESAANHVISKSISEKLCRPDAPASSNPHRQQPEHFKSFRVKGRRAVSGQDRTLWALLRPARLLALIYGYTLFDAGVRKIARYPQYFAVKAVVEKVSRLEQGRRRGGVIWHTTGSGKSLTMVMLAKALVLIPGIKNPRVVLVTDRVDLDKQISATFEACGKTAIRASTGEHLVKLIKEGKSGVITCVIDKFHTVIAKYKLIDANPDIFVLVDEGHRSNYGETARKMRRVFPNGAFIGFTGTPLLKKDKHTIRRFGGIIHSYSLYQATVEDHAVLPLIYEGRIAELGLCNDSLQAEFETIVGDLPHGEKAALASKVARRDKLNQAEKRIQLIAGDISHHYSANFLGSGLKAQLATESRASALLYRYFIRQLGQVQCEVIMSRPEAEDGGENGLTSASQFWNEMMTCYGSEKAYLDEVLGSFSRETGVDLLIVVDKLLTGFDEPRNTVLYVDKPLKGHNVLQAIARVNRLFAGKEMGYIIDYRGILGELNQTMNDFTTLLEPDSNDRRLDGVLSDSLAEVQRLPQLDAELWHLFDAVADKKVLSSLALHLATEPQRYRFNEVFTRYQRALSVALTTERFSRQTEPSRIERYKQDLKMFSRVRNILRERHAGEWELDARETQIQAIIDRHIQPSVVTTVTGMADIFDISAFNRELASYESKAAKAELIVGRLKKTLCEKMDEDPVFYQKFDQLVQQAVVDYRKGRFDEAAYLDKISTYLHTVRQGHEDDLPDRLVGRKEAQGYFHVVNEVLLQRETSAQDRIKDGVESYFEMPDASVAEAIATIALGIEALVKRRKIRDWFVNQDVLRQIQSDIDDYLFEKRTSTGIHFEFEEMDQILERCLLVARNLAAKP